MKKVTKTILSLLFVVSFAFIFSPSFAQQGFLPAQVKDISDRAYESAVIELLDGARESVVISMYNRAETCPS